jgi:hypothetical protein
MKHVYPFFSLDYLAHLPRSLHPFPCRAAIRNTLLIPCHRLGNPLILLC